MKVNVFFDGPEVSIIKYGVEREAIPNVDDMIRVQDPADNAIYNGYVTARSFDGDTCTLEVEQA